MKEINQFKEKIKFVFTDIDDTLTDEGRLGPEAHSALWELAKNNIHVIPVTGRPAGWCEMIARQWPVAGVVGENGGFYFRYHNRQMKRNFFFKPEEQKANRDKLNQICDEILKKVPGSALASDQFCRLMDLAIDYCEDIDRLSDSAIQKIVEIFESHGAHAKVSSIHVNGWFGEYNKLSQTLQFLKHEFDIHETEAKKLSIFCGDSPNDEPMWAFFPFGMAVANVKEYLPKLKSKPAFIADERGGKGFAQIAKQILKNVAHS